MIKCQNQYNSSARYFLAKEFRIERVLNSVYVMKSKQSVPLDVMTWILLESNNLDFFVLVSLSLGMIYCSPKFSREHFILLFLAENHVISSSLNQHTNRARASPKQWNTIRCPINYIFKILVCYQHCVSFLCIIFSSTKTQIQLSWCAQHCTQHNQLFIFLSLQYFRF